MLKDFLKEAISQIVGKSAENIVDYLYSSVHINEFLIAKKLGLTINQTRNILYKISNYGLASSIRKKDKRKGWFTYFWKIEVIKCLEFLKQNLIKKIEQINSQIKSRETKQFFVCERCNIEVTEEKALFNDFMCNECGEVYKMKDNSKIIKELKKILEKAEDKLTLIEKEINNEQEFIGKKKEKELKKAAKEKKKKIKKKLSKKTKTKIKKENRVKKKTKKKKR